MSISSHVDRVGPVDGPRSILVRARIEVLTPEQGGRKGPFFGNYRPNHNFGAAEDREFYIGQVNAPKGCKVHPGETCEVVVHFINAPGLDELLQVGRRWRIQEGPRLVATAEVLQRVPDADGPPDVVVFESDAFSLDCPTINGVKADLPLGEDLAAELGRRLRARHPELKIGDPVREDWGSVLHVGHGERAFWLNVHWTPLADSRDNCWAIQFSEVRGCLASLFLSKRPAHTSCAELIGHVRALLDEDSATFRNVRWLTNAEFNVLY